MWDVATATNWEDVLVAYAPVVLAILATWTATRAHLKKQDKRAEMVKSDLQDFNGTTQEQLDKVKTELEELNRKIK